MSLLFFAMAFLLWVKIG